jgi:hypothetical protein
MWEDFYSYLGVLWGDARWLLAGGPYFLDAIVRKTWPSGTEWLNTFVKPRVRRNIEIVIIIIAIFLAGFLAWRDEHHARLVAEGHLPNNRHLTDVDKNNLAKAFSGHDKDIPVVMISSISDSEAVRYAYEFYTAFKNLKFNTTFTTGVYSTNESDRGLMIGISDPDKPSDAAKLFVSLMLKAGFVVKQIRLGEPGSPPPGEFDLFIGDKQ